MEIELHESQTKVAEQSAALLVQQAHLQQQEAAMLAMQKMMAMMSAQIALIASPVPAVPPQAPPAIVAPTPPLSTRTRLTFSGYGVSSVLPAVRASMSMTPSTTPPPTEVSYRQADVARFKKQNASPRLRVECASPLPPGQQFAAPRGTSQSDGAPRLPPGQLALGHAGQVPA